MGGGAARPELTVILPTFNGAGTLGAQLEALDHQQSARRWELLIVDNGSNDATNAIASDFAASRSWVRVMVAADRHNLSYVRNAGVSAALADRVAFVDDDDLVAEGWVASILDALDHAPLVGSRLDYQLLNTPGALVGRESFQSEHLHRMFGLPTLAGGGLGCHRELWNAVGGNAEDLPDSGEDFDFSMRVARQLSVEPILVYDAVYHVRLRESPRSVFTQSRRYGQSHVQLYARHGRGSLSTAEKVSKAARDWWWIVTRAPMALVGIRRANWARIAGRRVGRLVGSIRHRAFLP